MIESWSDCVRGRLRCGKGHFTHNRIRNAETPIYAGTSALLEENSLKITYTQNNIKRQWLISCVMLGGSMVGNGTKGTAFPTKTERILGNQDPCPWFVRTHLNPSPSSLPCWESESPQDRFMSGQWAWELETVSHHLLKHSRTRPPICLCLQDRDSLYRSGWLWTQGHSLTQCPTWGQDLK